MQTNFKISGLNRRILKKEYNMLKSIIKNDWHFVQMEEDMYKFGLGDKPLTESENNDYIRRLTTRVSEIEILLKEQK